jgi:hypothetical protein
VQIETKLQEVKPIRFQVFFSLFSTGHYAPSYGATVLHHLIVTARTRSRHGVAIGSFSRIFSVWSSRVPALPPQIEVKCAQACPMSLCAGRLRRAWEGDASLAVIRVQEEEEEE